MKDELIKKLIEYIQGTKDFVLEQSPELFKEILKFDTIAAYLGTFVCLTLMSIGIYFSIKFYNIPYEKHYDRPVLHIMFWIITGALTPYLIVQTCSNIGDLIQIKVAPKYYILNKLKIDKK